VYRRLRLILSHPVRRIPPIPSTALATLTAALALLPLLGHKPLTDWDEAIYAEVSREMLAHSWLIPHWNYQLWLEKPPLMLWITAVFFHLFGVTEFWARAASALSGVAIIGILHLWLARTRDALTAWLSTLLLLGTFGFLHACHTGELDVMLALGCTIALIGLAQVEARVEAQVEARVGTNPSSGWLLFWIGFAIAAMTKGAASVTLPLTAVVLAVLQRWGFDRLRVAFWLGLALFLAIVLPWHLAMLHLYGGDFLREYLGFHVLARATRPIEGHNTSWWFYLEVLLVSAPPFILLYPAAIVLAFSRKQFRAFAVFALTTLAFFTVVQTRLPQYIVPVYPALAALNAVYVVDKLRPLLAAPRTAALWLKLAVAIAAISIAFVWATTPARKALHSSNSAGVSTSDSKDSTALLRDLLDHPQTSQSQSIERPLLVWHPGRVMSMPTDVYYARRPVEQVLLIPIAPEPPDRYTFNPEPTDEAITLRPRLILLDRNLVAQIPTGFTYTRIESHGAMELGTIARMQ
jgi:4-amino-4-deoxy-L-arabinose transferase-like glycosyltransferase